MTDASGITPASDEMVAELERLHTANVCPCGCKRARCNGCADAPWPCQVARLLARLREAEGYREDLVTMMRAQELTAEALETAGWEAAGLRDERDESYSTTLPRIIEQRDAALARVESLDELLSEVEGCAEQEVQGCESCNRILKKMRAALASPDGTTEGE